MKTYLVANHLGSVTTIEIGEGVPLPDCVVSAELPEGASKLCLRYGVVDGAIVDKFPGKSDEEVLAQVAADNAAAQAAVDAEIAAEAAKLTKLQFMSLFKDEELVALYTAAKQSVQVEVWLEKLKLSEMVDLMDPRTIAGVNSLAAAGLLTAERAAQILSNTAA